MLAWSLLDYKLSSVLPRELVTTTKRTGVLGRFRDTVWRQFVYLKHSPGMFITTGMTLGFWVTVLV